MPKVEIRSKCTQDSDINELALAMFTNTKLKIAVISVFHMFGTKNSRYISTQTECVEIKGKCRGD